jgi:hypothetical protein
MGLLILVLLILLIVGALPHWGYHKYGYGPVGVLVVVLLVVLLLSLLTPLPFHTFTVREPSP